MKYVFTAACLFNHAVVLSVVACEHTHTHTHTHTHMHVCVSLHSLFTVVSTLKVLNIYFQSFYHISLCKHCMFGMLVFLFLNNFWPILTKKAAKNLSYTLFG